MQIQNPNYREYVQEIFATSSFVSELGIRLHDVGPGWCETRLEVLTKHLQQTNFVHAGVQASMADHTAGGAAATLIKPTETVLAVEFKINLLRPAVGNVLRCRANVIKPGKRFIIVEAEVWSFQQGEEKLVSKTLETVAVVPNVEKSK